MKRFLMAAGALFVSSTAFAQCTGIPSANTVCAGPATGSGQFAGRKLVPADLPAPTVQRFLTPGTFQCTVTAWSRITIKAGGAGGQGSTTTGASGTNGSDGQPSSFNDWVANPGSGGGAGVGGSGGADGTTGILVDRIPGERAQTGASWSIPAGGLINIAGRAGAGAGGGLAGFSSDGSAAKPNSGGGGGGAGPGARTDGYAGAGGGEGEKVIIRVPPGTYTVTVGDGGAGAPGVAGTSFAGGAGGSGYVVAETP